MSVFWTIKPIYKENYMLININQITTIEPYVDTMPYSSTKGETLYRVTFSSGENEDINKEEYERLFKVLRRNNGERR